MSPQSERVTKLIHLFLHKKLNEADKRELEEWLKEDEVNKAFFDRLRPAHYPLEAMQEKEEVDTEIWQKIHLRLKHGEEPRIRHSREKNRGRSLLMAASIATIVTIGGVWWWKTRPELPLAQRPQEQRFKSEIPAGGSGAVLTLEDGRKIYLDSARDGLLATHQGIEVIKTGGEIIYRKKGNEASPQYHHISTERGKEYQLSLPDGSRVYLNNASSIRFEATFAGQERAVEVSGELLFEVKKERRPFVVRHEGLQVEVLGTRFLVNTFGDEPYRTATLVEGTVRVKGGNDEVVLKEGQQARLSGDRLSIEDNVNVEAQLAWASGNFYFEDAHVETVMRQLSRWYDVEVRFAGRLDKYFYLNVSRKVPLTRILKIMELSGDIHFTLEGKELTIYP